MKIHFPLQPESGHCVASWPADMSKEMSDNLREVMAKRTQYLEMFVAAFIKEVGAEEASKYTLVERFDVQNYRHSWCFQRTTES